MNKLRIVINVVIEYEADPDNYPEDQRTPEQMLAIDLANAEDDPFLTMDSPFAKWTTAGEIIKATE